MASQFSFIFYIFTFTLCLYGKLGMQLAVEENRFENMLPNFSESFLYTDFVYGACKSTDESLLLLLLLLL